VRLRLPFITRRQYEQTFAELAAVAADRDRIRGERDQFAKDRDAVQAAAQDRNLDTLEEHDVHRKALADALGASQHLTWDQLLITALRAREALSECRAEADAERKRADHLETGSETGRLKRRVAHLQRQLDDATFLPQDRVEDSAGSPATRSRRGVRRESVAGPRAARRRRDGRLPVPLLLHPRRPSPRPGTAVRGGARQVRSHLRRGGPAHGARPVPARRGHVPGVPQHQPTPTHHHNHPGELMTALFDLTPEAPAAPVAAGPRHRLYRVAGIDVSLTGTGVATLSGTTLIATKGRRKDSIAQRRTRIKGIVDQVLIEIGVVDLAVVEGPSHHSVGGSVWDRAGLWWRIVDGLCARDIPIAVVPPMSRAKYATGKGNSRKSAVLDAAQTRYGAILPTDDEADALILRAMGLEWLGQALAEVPDGHRAALAGVQWPDREAVAR
jgi:hypothetical protein